VILVRGLFPWPSLILRRSRSPAATQSLPSPPAGPHSRPRPRRHDALVLSAPIATLLRIGQKWHLRARYSKLYFLKFLISENMLHSIWLAERTRTSWRHEHDLEWSPSDGEGTECVAAGDLDRLRIRLIEALIIKYIYCEGNKRPFCSTPRFPVLTTTTLCTIIQLIASFWKASKRWLCRKQRNKEPGKDLIYFKTLFKQQVFFLKMQRNTTLHFVMLSY